MKKIILVAAAALMAFAANAQQGKFACVNFEELVMLMPEMDEARAVLEENSKQSEEILMAMYEEHQTKVQQYEQKSSTWTGAILEAKQREIVEIEQRIQQTQQNLQQELQALQQKLQAPAVEKARKVVSDLAKEKGVAAVMEAGAFLYVDPEQVIDLTEDARKALNIPEGRTLETLQAELMAKAQAQQGAQK